MHSVSQQSTTKMRFWRIRPSVILFGADILPIDSPFEHTAFLIKVGGYVVAWLLLCLPCCFIIVLCIVVLVIAIYLYLNLYGWTHMYSHVVVE